MFLLSLIKNRKLPFSINSFFALSLPNRINIQLILIFFKTSLLFIILIGCSTDVKISSINENSKNPSLLDFEKTEILVGNPVAANGSDELIIVVHLKNSDNSSIPNYKPTFDLPQMSGMQFSECTTSDLNGVSVCKIKSLKPGIKTITLANAKVGLSKTVEFTQPQGSQRMALLSGNNKSSTQNNYTIQTNAGHTHQGIRRQTTDGYMVTFSLQGVNQ